jgi:hypothetical protein
MRSEGPVGKSQIVFSSARRPRRAMPLESVREADGGEALVALDPGM